MTDKRNQQIQQYEERLVKGSAWLFCLGPVLLIVIVALCLLLGVALAITHASQANEHPDLTYPISIHDALAPLTDATRYNRSPGTDDYYKDQTTPVKPYRGDFRPQPDTRHGVTPKVFSRGPLTRLNGVLTPEAYRETERVFHEVLRVRGEDFLFKTLMWHVAGILEGEIETPVPVHPNRWGLMFEVGDGSGSLMTTWYRALAYQSYREKEALTPCANAYRNLIMDATSLISDPIEREEFIGELLSILKSVGRED